MSKTRIAVAGAGYIGQAHMGVARKSATVTLSAIVDPSPHAKATAEAAGVPLYTSLAELFAKDKPDGVVLSPGPGELSVLQDQVQNLTLDEVDGQQHHRAQW